MNDLRIGAIIGIIATIAIFWPIITAEKSKAKPVERFECRNGRLWYGSDENVRPLKSRSGFVWCKKEK